MTLVVIHTQKHTSKSPIRQKANDNLRMTFMILRKIGGAYYTTIIRQITQVNNYNSVKQMKDNRAISYKYFAITEQKKNEQNQFLTMFRKC